MKKAFLWLGFVLLNLSSVFVLADFKPESSAKASLPIISLPMGADKLEFENYRGKVVLLDFWASWCGPCRQSFPWMNEMQAKYAEQDLVIIAVNLDQEKQAAADFLAAVPAIFKITYDPDGKSAEIMDVVGMPMSYLVDRLGHVRHRLIGFNSNKKKQHEGYIIGLLNETTH